MLLCEIACRFLLNVRLNNNVWRTYEARPITDQLDHLCSTDVCVWIASSLSTLHVPLASCLHIVAPLFNKSDIHSVSLTLSASLFLSSSFFHSTRLLRLCESVALRGRASFFWNPAIGHGDDGSGSKSIVETSIEYLHPLTNHFWQGIHNRLHWGAVGFAFDGELRWNSWEQEIGRLGFTCVVSEPLPTLPRDHPCSTVLAAHWVFGKSTPYLQKSTESLKWSWCIGRGPKQYLFFHVSCGKNKQTKKDFFSWLNYFIFLTF